MMMRKMVVALMAACSAAAVQAQESYRPEDVVKAEPVSLAPSTDGKPDIARFLLVRTPRSPMPLARGEGIAFISDVTGVPQLWAMPEGGGFPQQLTYGSGVDWADAAPGGGILYGADTDGDERVGMFHIDAAGVTERTVVAKAPAFRNFGAWDKAGARFVYASTERNGRDFDVWVATLDGATRRVLEANGTSYYPQAWQPGGNLVVLTEPRGEMADVHLLDVSTGTRTTLFKPKEAAHHLGFQWTPDGRGFYFAHDQGRDHHVIAFYDVAAKKLTTVAEPARDVLGVRLSDDGRFLTWTENDTGFDRLRVRDLSTGKDVAAPQLPAGSINDAAPVPGTSRFLVWLNSSKTAGEVWDWDPASGAVKRLIAADTPGLDLARMVEPEPVAFPARDGAPLTGLLYLPQGVAKPPVYINVHGGPSAHASAGFNAFIQYLVARGIAVLDFNYRGSTGQGKRFASLNDREKKVDEVGDLADAVGWLRKSGRVDGARIAVGGGSYGGYLTNQALGTYPSMFIAGVSIVGVSDWVSALEGASPALKASDKLEFGDISDPKVRAFFAKLSPINNVAKIKTPLMVLHGANDPRDPVAESDRLVAGVRANGGTVTYLRFPDEGHGIAKLANRVHAYRRIAAFLEERFGMAR
jgi:dipeptidyl aminopeptidase/acylaminoacyl peptidase